MKKNFLVLMLVPCMILSLLGMSTSVKGQSDETAQTEAESAEINEALFPQNEAETAETDDEHYLSAEIADIEIVDDIEEDSVSAEAKGTLPIGDAEENKASAEAKYFYGVNEDWSSAAAVAARCFTGTVGAEMSDTSSHSQSTLSADFSSGWGIDNGVLVRQDTVTLHQEETTIVKTSVNVTTAPAAKLGGKTQWLWGETIDFGSASSTYETYYQNRFANLIIRIRSISSTFYRNQLRCFR